MAKRDSAWDFGLHLGKKIGVPTSVKGLVTGTGAGLTIGGLVKNDNALIVAGLFAAFIGITS